LFSLIFAKNNFTKPSLFFTNHDFYPFTDNIFLCRQASTLVFYIFKNISMNIKYVQDVLLQYKESLKKKKKKKKKQLDKLCS